MAKPIFLVAVPNAIAHQFQDVQKDLEKQLTDYYVITYLHSKEDFEFRALFEKDFDEVKFEELKDIVSNSGVNL